MFACIIGVNLVLSLVETAGLASAASPPSCSVWVKTWPFWRSNSVQFESLTLTFKRWLTTQPGCITIPNWNEKNAIRQGSPLKILCLLHDNVFLQLGARFTILYGILAVKIDMNCAMYYSSIQDRNSYSVRPCVALCLYVLYLTGRAELQLHQIGPSVILPSLETRSPQDLPPRAENLSDAASPPANRIVQKSKNRTLHFCGAEFWRLIT